MMKSEFLELKENTLITPEENTQYVAVLPTSGASKYSLELEFQKQGVSCEVIILGNLKSGAEAFLKTVSDHLVPNTSCITNYLVSLSDNSSSDYTGKIFIARNAFQTNSYLNNRTLVTGDQTKNTTRPILEIEADDVKASHGSSTGRVSKEDVFYLTSRGLSEKEAEDLLVEGFFENIISGIRDADVREKVRNKLKS